MKRIPLMYIALILAGIAHAQEATQPPKHKIGVSQYELPKYPPIARAARIEGPVIVHFTVRSDGNLDNAVIVRGHPILASAVKSVVSRWRFLCLDCNIGEQFEHEMRFVFRIATDDRCSSPVSCVIPLFPDKVELVVQEIIIIIENGNVRKQPTGDPVSIP